PAAVVHKFENVPVEHKHKVNTGRLLNLLLAIGVLLPTPVAMSLLLYKQKVIKLPVGADLLDLNISASGCDVSLVPHSHLQARLSYWRFFGSDSMEVVNNTLLVEASYTRKILMMRCVITVFLPEGLTHFKSASITIRPDSSEEVMQRESCSNTMQMLSVTMSHLKLRDHLLVNVSTIAMTELFDVAASRMEVIVAGGKLVLQGDLPTEANIAAQDALVTVSGIAPMRVQVAKEAVPNVNMAAVKIQASTSEHVYKLSGASLPTRAVRVLSAEGSAVYIQANEHPDASLCQLQVVRGRPATNSTILHPHTSKLEATLPSGYCMNTSSRSSDPSCTSTSLLRMPHRA
ncbi:unnamed protein product, partial [Effrenium voratum]